MNTSLSLSLPPRSAAAALTLVAGVAQAHEGHGVHGAFDLAAGLAHPFAGLDHLLAMLAVGLWSAAALPAVRRLAGPALFLCALLAGALAGAQTGAGGLVEVGVAFSVVLFGVALLARRQLPRRPVSHWSPRLVRCTAWRTARNGQRAHPSPAMPPASCSVRRCCTAPAWLPVRGWPACRPGCGVPTPR
jgi:hypothetical protein